MHNAVLLQVLKGLFMDSLQSQIYSHPQTIRVCYQILINTFYVDGVVLAVVDDGVWYYTECVQLLYSVMISDINCCDCNLHYYFLILL